MTLLGPVADRQLRVGDVEKAAIQGWKGSATPTNPYCGHYALASYILQGVIAMQRSVQMFAMISLIVVAGCSGEPTRAPQQVDTRAIETTAHGSYVAAINSNDVDSLLANLTDDVVYQAPGAPEVIGKAAARAWVAAYFGAYRTRWEKTSIGFTVSGDWAFERYTYRSTDTDKKTGAITTDMGKDINIYRRGPDGKWRVAIDGWSSDKAAA